MRLAACVRPAIRPAAIASARRRGTPRIGLWFWHQGIHMEHGMSELDHNIESRNDVRYAFENLLKNHRAHGVTWRREVLDRYKNGRLSFHFHCVIRCGTARLGTCCEINHQPDAALAVPLPCSVPINRDSSGICDPAAAKQQRSVLVHPYEFIKGKQALIPSVIRLNALNYGDGRCWNSTTALQVIRRPIRLGETAVICGDRESDAPQLAVCQANPRASARAHGQFPCDVIKAGAKICDKIPDYAREAIGRLDCDDAFDLYDVTIRFGDDIVGFCAYVAPSLFIERFQVLLSPDDLEPSTV